MKPREDYETRTKMAEMHDIYQERLRMAYEQQNYVETVWLCYAIFEQRVNRLIAKYIDQCPKKERDNDKTAAITTRMNCIKRLVKEKYGAFDGFDISVIKRVEQWCRVRNDLVHGLVELKHYKKYDKEFEALAKAGVPLVQELYDACTELRNQWYCMDEESAEFPAEKCKCGKTKCMNPTFI